MGTNYNQIDWYTNFTVVIAAGQSRKIAKLGKYVTILSNSGADPRIQINGQNGGIIPNGLSLELPPAESFDKLEFVNESASSITMQIAVSNGKIIDSRTVLSGSVEIKNDPLNTPLDVDDANTQAKLDSVIALLGSAFNKIGDNYESTTASGTTVLIDGTTDNPIGGDGIWIRTFSTQNDNNAVNQSLLVDGNSIFEWDTDAQRAMNPLINLPIFVAAGIAVSVTHSQTGGFSSLTWDAA